MVREEAISPSTIKKPARQKTEASKTRTLKNADCEVDFVFIAEFGIWGVLFGLPSMYLGSEPRFLTECHEARQANFLKNFGNFWGKVTRFQPKTLITPIVTNRMTWGSIEVTPFVGIRAIRVCLPLR